MLLDLVRKSKATSTGNTPEAQLAAVETSPLPPPTIVPRAGIVSPNPADTASHSVLGSDIEVKGSIRFSRALVIDGRVEGDICSDGILTVGEHGVVHGEIKTRAAIILGNVEGNITTQERCELKDTATIIGDITAGTLTITEGASFIGRSHIGQRQSTAKSAYVQEDKSVGTLPKKSPEETPAQASADIPVLKAA